MRKLALAGLAFVCTMACAGDQHISEAIVGARAARTWSPYPLPRSAVGFVSWGRDRGEVLRSLRELNPGKVRVVVNWPEMEPAEGVYSEGYKAEVHAYLDTLAAIGATAYINFVWTPDWAKRPAVAYSDPTLAACFNGDITPPRPEYYEAFRQFIATMVDEFGPGSSHWGKATYFGYGNEINAAGHFAVPIGEDPVQTYSTLVNIAAPEIKSRGGLVVAPEMALGGDCRRAQQYIPSLYGPPNYPGDRTDMDRWLSDYMADGAGWTTDVISVHAYAGTGQVNDPYPGVADVAHARLTNNGVWPYGNWRFWISEAGVAHNDLIMDPDNQARWLVKAYSDFSNYRASHSGTRWDALLTFQHWERPANVAPLPNDLLYNLMDYTDENNFYKKPAYWCLWMLTRGWPPSELTPPSC